MQGIVVVAARGFAAEPTDEDAARLIADVGSLTAGEIALKAISTICAIPNPTSCCIVRVVPMSMVASNSSAIVRHAFAGGHPRERNAFGNEVADPGLKAHAHPVALCVDLLSKPIESQLSLHGTGEAALEAIRTCSAKGYDVTATVVDVAGIPQVVLRGDHATIHTKDSAYRKAYTIVTIGPICHIGHPATESPLSSDHAVPGQP